MGFKENLKRILLKRHLSLRELALKAGVSPALLSRILDGRTSPTLKTIEKISKALGIEESDLVKEKESKKEDLSLIEVALRKQEELTDQDIESIKSFIEFVMKKKKNE